MSFNFTCPFCNQAMECEDAWAGMTAKCPACNRDIVLNPPASAIPPPPMTYSTANTQPPEATLGSTGKWLCWLAGVIDFIFLPLGPIAMMIIFSIVKSKYPELAKPMRKYELNGFVFAVVSSVLIFVAFVALSIT